VRRRRAGAALEKSGISRRKLLNQCQRLKFGGK
jgi:hypothetical protein